MQTNKKLQLNKYCRVLCIGFLIIVLCACSQPDPSSQVGIIKEEVIIPVADTGMNQLVDTRTFISKDAFNASIDGPIHYELSEVIGGVIPHHDVAAYMLGDFYASIAQVEHPDVIFIIGPNHKGLGERFQTGKYTYNTYAGTIYTQDNLVDQMCKDNLVSMADNKLFTTEHSLNIHMNYIRYFFENTTVVPLLVSETRNEGNLDELAEKISEITKGQTCLFLCSIDFSHYLTLEEANAKDEITRMYLEEVNQEQLIHLSNDYLDCPSALVLILKVLEYSGDINCEILDHNNSEVVLREKGLEETTSYFSVAIRSKGGEPSN